MNGVDFSGCRCMVRFAERSLDPEHVKERIRYGRSHNSIRFLNVFLLSSDYRSALNSIWSTKHRMCLNYLRNPRFQVHALILLERAVVEFIAEPDRRTLDTVSLPLMYAGYVRIMQDMKCSNDRSVSYGDIASRICAVYIARLNKATQKNLGISLDEVMAEKNHDRDAKMCKIQETIVEQSKKGLLPKPDWISWSGIVPIIYGTIAMKPEEEHQKIRLACAQQTVSDFAYLKWSQGVK